MKRLSCLVVVLAALGAEAGTVHRSFRNGYPAGAQGATVRQPQNAAALKAPATAKPKTRVITNRVVVTRAPAVKPQADKQR